MEFRFDCVFYYVRNLERSIRFYRDVLGFRLVSRDAVARFAVDSVAFELVPAHSAEQLPGTGNARLCLRVADVAATLRELQSQAVSTREAQEKGDGVLGVFEDPDGNELCLWQSKTTPH